MVGHVWTGWPGRLHASLLLQLCMQPARRMHLILHLLVVWPRLCSLPEPPPRMRTRRCRPPRFLLMYLSAAVAGNVASFLGAPKSVSLGASGAVFGIGGALAMYFYRNRWGALLGLGLSQAPSRTRGAARSPNSSREDPQHRSAASCQVFWPGSRLHASPNNLRRDIYGKTSDRVLRQLWQTLVLNVVYGLSSTRIDNW